MGLGALLTVAAFAWGLAEATLFFLVPDILLTYIVIYRPRLFWRAFAATLVGALIGGAILYNAGQHRPDASLQLLARIPAVTPGLIEQAGDDLQRKGLPALLIGSLTGTPYKLYAAQAHAAGIGLAAFLIFSIPARAARWLLLCGATWLIAKTIPERYGTKPAVLILSLIWLTTYVVYFSIMGF
jgi:membrane protein YqaA with SNARE-associated domain